MDPSDTYWRSPDCHSSCMSVRRSSGAGGSAADGPVAELGAGDQVKPAMWVDDRGDQRGPEEGSHLRSTLVRPPCRVSHDMITSSSRIPGPPEPSPVDRRPDLRSTIIEDLISNQERP